MKPIIFARLGSVFNEQVIRIPDMDAYHRLFDIVEDCVTFEVRAALKGEL